ncbi:hypothetical protein AVKW3434_16065 [Acidovorax sp. SUPP3434]|nr:hypothetical protein AVKW3434_16065 [Acidovorax sp. SUPP3434]
MAARNPLSGNAAEAAAYLRAPRAHLPLPDLNTALPQPPNLPDLNTALPQPPNLPDLNAALPQPPDLPDLNAALPQPPDLPDLNAALPASSEEYAAQPHPLDLNNTPPPSPDAWSETSDSEEESWQSENEAAPDPLTLPFANHAALGVHGTPHSSQVFALLDQLNAQPELAPQVLRVSADLLVELGALPELRDGLEARARDSTLHPVTTEAIRQLMGILIDFENEDVESEDEGEENEQDELARDLKRQTRPLGWEAAQWLGPDHPEAAALSAFDDEPQAPAFARLLARLRDAGREGPEGGSSTVAAQRGEQVAAVIHAIAGDPDLRAQVYLIAQTALGSCQDNVLEGFSKALLAVRNHQMVADIRSGRVDATQFQRWARQQFRLALLESEVTRFIHQELQRPDLGPWPKRQLTREPLETLMHAKQALRDRLDLPEGTVTGVQALQLSVLRQNNVADLARAVEQQASDPTAYGEFRFNHPTWREGMKALHPREFGQLTTARDDDPFFDEDLPQGLEAEVEYAIRSRAVEAKWLHEENLLLRHLGKIGAPDPSMKPEPDMA